MSILIAARLHLAPDLVDRRINQRADLRRMLHGAISALRHAPPVRASRDQSRRPVF